jgi:hypothetical protein
MNGLKFFSISTNQGINSGHADGILKCSNTITITLPNSMPIMKVDFINEGTGVIAFVAVGTLHAEGTKLATRYTACTAIHEGNNVWVLIGRLTT